METNRYYVRCKEKGSTSTSTSTSSNNNFHRQQVDEFVDKLRVRDWVLHKNFSNVFHSFMKGDVKVLDARPLLSAMLEDHQDLMNEFNRVWKFVESAILPTNNQLSSSTPSSTPMDQVHSAARSDGKKSDNKAPRGRLVTCAQRMDLEAQGTGFFNKVQEKLSKESYEVLLKCFCCYSSGMIQRNELKEIIIASILYEFPELIDDFKIFMENCETIDDDVEIKEEAVEIHTEDQNLEKGRIKFTRKDDQNREIRTIFEDDWDEINMLLLWLGNAAHYAESRVRELEPGAIRLIQVREQPPEIANFMTRFKRCLESLYGDFWPHVSEILEKNPTCASYEIVGVRLRQKIEELTNFKEEMRKMWARVY